MNENEVEQILKEINNNKMKKQQELFSNTAEQPKEEKEPVIDVPFDTELPKPEPEQETQVEKEEVAEPQLELHEQELTEEPQPDEEQETDEEDEEQVAEDSQSEEQEDTQEEAEENEADGVYFAEYEEEEPEPEASDKRNKIIIAAVCVVVAVAVALGVYFGFFHNKQTEEPSTEQPTVTQGVTVAEPKTLNPLTGEAGYDESALSKKPVAVVVENEYSTAAVKPQWGIAQADIVMEGESEFSTRMLMFWADYNKMPKQIGPTRSARPPFIRFSQLFNAVFIHAGLSRTAGGYVGADTVFENENVDHINLLSLSEGGEYFGRDYSRTKVVEHTGYLNGTKVAKLLESKNINTDLNMSKFSALSFNREEKKLSDTQAKNVSFKWSSNCPKNAKFTYDEASGKYTTSDFDSKYGKSEVAWENLIFLLDTTRYVVKENYKGSGKSETYCDYELSGGKGIICSNATAVEIQWGVTDGKLWIKDLSGNPVSLNPGKIYIGYGSSNHGGSYSISDSSDTQSVTKN